MSTRNWRTPDYDLPYAVAAYPTKFKGTVISPTKICLQYEEVQLLARPLGLDTGMLEKGINGNKNLPVSTNGTNVSIIAVGSQIPVLEQMILEVLESFVEYHKLHKDRYEKEYGRPFTDYLKVLKVELDRTILRVNKQEFINEP